MLGKGERKRCQSLPLAKTSMRLARQEQYQMNNVHWMYADAVMHFAHTVLLRGVLDYSYQTNNKKLNLKRVQTLRLMVFACAWNCGLSFLGRGAAPPPTTMLCCNATQMQTPPPPNKESVRLFVMLHLR